MRIGKSFNSRKNFGFWIVLLLGALFIVRGLVKYPPSDPKPLSSDSVRLYRHQSGKVIVLDFEEYLVGVVAAEMPASFELEALKAQAVCARTYAYSRILEQHEYPGGAHLTDEVANCQAYVSEAEFALAHPYQTELYYDKIRKAVADTRGMIMSYAGKPVDAVYHSTCGGSTEDAAEAWGRTVDYLAAVSCNYCSASKYYQKTAFFSGQSLQELLELSHPVKEWTVLEKSNSGRAKSVRLDEKTLSGEAIRALLQLPSRHIEIQAEDGGFNVITRGYGHGVGLCQYGAGGQAAAGRKMEEILKYYYQGITISGI